MGHVHIHVHDAGSEKVEKTMHEFKQGELHSGSKKGPLVKKRRQAIAIALKQAGKSNQDAGTSEGARKAAATRKAHGHGAQKRPTTGSARHAPGYTPGEFHTHLSRRGYTHQGGGVYKHSGAGSHASLGREGHSVHIKQNGFEGKVNGKTVASGNKTRQLIRHLQQMGHDPQAQAKTAKAMSELSKQNWKPDEFSRMLRKYN